MLKKFDPAAHKLVPAALLVLAWAYLLWVAGTLTVDYFDGFEYILTGSALSGASLGFNPKSPLLSSLLGLVQLLVKGLPPSLTPFHLAVALVNLSGISIIAAWIRRYCPSLGFFEIAAVLTFNRLVVHYVPFAMTDLPAAGLVGFWLWAEARSPLSSRDGKLRRIAALSLCVLGRAPIALIPGVSLLVDAWRSRQPRAALEVGLASAAAILAAMGVFNMLAGNGFWASFAHFLALAQGQFLHNSARVAASPLRFFPFFFLLLTPAGFLLLVLGSVKGLRRESGLPPLTNLLGPALGVLCFIAFMMFVWSNKEARYLGPLLPFWALIQCRGTAWLAGKKAWAGTLAIAVLFVSVVPEFLHFAQPFYRAGGERKAALEIARWSRSPQAVFVGWASAAMVPEKHVFSLNDDYFYVYHWSSGAYSFFTRQPAWFAWPIATFSQYGYPIPDHLQDIAGPGATMIAPSEQTYVTENIPDRLPPIYALRWFPKEAGAAGCSPVVPELCVQILTVNPREDKSPDSLTPPEKGADPDAALMKEGLKALYEQKDPMRAQGLFRAVLERNPMHYGATFQLAVALDNSGARPAARPVWKRALALAESYHDQDTANRIRARLQSEP